MSYSFFHMASLTKQERQSSTDSIPAPVGLYGGADDKAHAIQEVYGVHTSNVKHRNLLSDVLCLKGKDGIAITY